jgi:hypothetical protein
MLEKLDQCWALSRIWHLFLANLQKLPAACRISIADTELLCSESGLRYDTRANSQMSTLSMLPNLARKKSSTQDCSRLISVSTKRNGSKPKIQSEWLTCPTCDRQRNLKHRHRSQPKEWEVLFATNTLGSGDSTRNLVCDWVPHRCSIRASGHAITPPVHISKQGSNAVLVCIRSYFWPWTEFLAMVETTSYEKRPDVVLELLIWLPKCMGENIVKGMFEALHSQKRPVDIARMRGEKGSDVWYG